MVTEETDHVVDAVALSGDERTELLSSGRRQTLVELLANSDDDVHTLESLATAITQTEQGTDLGTRPSHRVCLFLRHVHLPKLDAADLVDYDPQRNLVECTGSGQLDRLLETTGR